VYVSVQPAYFFNLTSDINRMTAELQGLLANRSHYDSHQSFLMRTGKLPYQRATNFYAVQVPPSFVHSPTPIGQNK
jgi:hypothetical protein